MAYLEILIECDPIPVDSPTGGPTSWAVITHERDSPRKLTTIIRTVFPTESAARDHMRELISVGARWVRPDMKPTRDYPDIRAWKTTEGLHLTIDGVTVVAGVTDPRTLKRAILGHPRGSALTPAFCPRCELKPVVNLLENTLRHDSACPIKIVIADQRIPIVLKVAAWNHFMGMRHNEISIDPMTLPHLEQLGLLREPTQGEMIARIRRIETLDDSDD